MDQKMSKITQIHFSPTRTTAGIVNRIASVFDASDQASLMQEIQPVAFKKTDTVIVGMPVFAGRIPALAKQRLLNIKGDQTPAIAVVVYGNRDYEDALLELKETLEQNGFRVIAAGAFIARHSLFPAVAADRPDRDDLKIIDDFAARCIEKIKNKDFSSVSVPGKKPYKEALPVPLYPSVSDACVSCLKCVEMCPVRAISQENPKETDFSKCISCGACVHVCPVHARCFKGEMYEKAQQMIVPKCATYLKPEIFL